MVQSAERTHWSLGQRFWVFLLAATSIACLLAEFYGLCSMRWFSLWIFGPATILLAVIAVIDRVRGSGVLAGPIATGAVAGLAATLAYDLFRFPFVWAKELGITAVIPHLPLFKVFPRFGAMLLAQAIEQPAYSLGAQILGWTYHFSNGITFGIMYVALIGDGIRRHWAWAVLFAVGLELGMLFTPYTAVFSITLSVTFVLATLAAHAVFGATLGWLTRRISTLRPRGSIVAA